MQDTCNGTDDEQAHRDTWRAMEHLQAAGLAAAIACHLRPRAGPYSAGWRSALLRGDGGYAAQGPRTEAWARPPQPPTSRMQRRSPRRSNGGETISGFLQWYLRDMVAAYAAGKWRPERP